MSYFRRPVPLVPRGVFCGAGQVLDLLGPAVGAHPTEEVIHGEEGRGHHCRRGRCLQPAVPSRQGRPQAGELTLCTLNYMCCSVRQFVSIP